MPLLFLLSFTTACAPQGDTMLGLVCYATQTEVSSDELLSIGFTVDEALGEMAGSRTFDATHVAGPQTEITIDLARGDGAAVLVEYFDPETDQPSDECSDYVSIPIDTQIITADGAFDFTASMTLDIEEVDTGCLHAELPTDSNQGSFGVELGADETSTYSLTHCISDGTRVLGELAVVTETTSGSGEEATISSISDTVMLWEFDG